MAKSNASKDAEDLTEKIVYVNISDENKVKSLLKKETEARRKYGYIKQVKING